MTIVDNTARSRFELAMEDEPAPAYIDYQRRNDVVHLLYACVPAHLNGRGIGSQLVRETMELLRSRGELMTPVCGFIRLWMQRHPEYHDLLSSQ